MQVKKIQNKENFSKKFQEWHLEFQYYLINSRSCSTKTTQSYQTDFIDFLDAFNRFNEPFDPQDKESYLIKLSFWVQTQSWHKLAPSSQLRKVYSLRSFFKFLEQQKYLNKEIHTRLQGPRLPQKLPHYLSLDEAICLAKMCTPIQNRGHLSFWILYLMGLRVSELVALKWSDLAPDFTSALVQGKGQKQRHVAIPNSLRTYLINLKGHLSGQQYLINPHATPQQIYWDLRQLGTQAGLIKRLTPHTLRHSYATHLLSDGIDLRILQELLGHQSLVATQKYTHLSLSKLAQTINQSHPLNHNPECLEIASSTDSSYNATNTKGTSHEQSSTTRLPFKRTLTP